MARLDLRRRWKEYVFVIVSLLLIYPFLNYLGINKLSSSDYNLVVGIVVFVLIFSVGFVFDRKIMFKRLLPGNGFSGYDLAAIFAVLAVIVFVFWLILGLTNNNLDLVGSFALIALFVAVLFAVGEIMNRISTYEMRKLPGMENAQIDSSVVLLGSGASTIEFAELPGVASDCAFAINAEGIAYKPRILYSKRPLVRIRKDEIMEISMGEQSISAGNIEYKGGGAKSTAVIGTANAVLESLDRRKALDRIKVVLKTKDGKEHVFLFGKRQKKILESLAKLKEEIG